MTIADEFREEGMKKGIEQGMKKGIEQGMKKGIEQGMKKGIEQGIEKSLLVLKSLLEDGLISNEIFQQRAALLQSSTTMV